jgi:hypothetical protein
MEQQEVKVEEPKKTEKKFISKLKKFGIRSVEFALVAGGAILAYKNWDKLKEVPGKVIGALKHSDETTTEPEQPESVDLEEKANELDRQEDNRVYNNENRRQYDGYHNRNNNYQNRNK